MLVSAAAMPGLATREQHDTAAVELAGLPAGALGPEACRRGSATPEAAASTRYLSLGFADFTTARDTKMSSIHPSANSKSLSVKCPLPPVAAGQLS